MPGLRRNNGFAELWNCGGLRWRCAGITELWNNGITEGYVLLRRNHGTMDFLKPYSFEVAYSRMCQLLELKSPVSTDHDLESKVTAVLHNMGVPAHIKGYGFLRQSIIMAVEDPHVISLVTKRLYPDIAKLNNTTASRVERAIRHAIEVAWDRGNVDVLNEYFGYTINNMRGKPTNSEFVAMISDNIRLENKKYKMG